MGGQERQELLRQQLQHQEQERQELLRSQLQHQEQERQELLRLQLQRQEQERQELLRSQLQRQEQERQELLRSQSQRQERVGVQEHLGGQDQKLERRLLLLRAGAPHGNRPVVRPPTPCPSTWRFSSSDVY